MLEAVSVGLFLDSPIGVVYINKTVLKQYSAHHANCYCPLYLVRHLIIKYVGGPLVAQTVQKPFNLLLEKL